MAVFSFMYNKAMKIKEHTISITEDEKETIGLALEAYLVQEMRVSKDMETLRLLDNETLQLLQDFIDCGYTPTITSGDFHSKDFNMERHTDAWEWAEDKMNFLVS